MAVVGYVVPNEARMPHGRRKSPRASFDRVRKRRASCQAVNKLHSLRQCADVITIGIVQQAQVDRQRLTWIAARQADTTARARIDMIGQDAEREKPGIILRLIGDDVEIGSSF